ncbi:hypothetical protein ACFQ3R_00720, partial [Mesonia ostreae]
MKKITFVVFLLCMGLFSYQLSAQVISEDFESGLGTYENATGNNVDWLVNTSLFQSGMQSISNAYTETNNNSVFLTTPVDLTGVTNPQLSFWHIAKTEGGWDEAIVEISTDGGTTWNAFLAEDYQGGGVLEGPGIFDEDSYPLWGTTNVTPDNTWWKREFFDLSDYMTDSVVIRFRLDSDSSANRAGWFLDDVEIIEVTCPMPSAIVANNIGPNSADITWTAGATETEWEILYGLAGFDPETEGTSVIDNDGTLGETITSLTAVETYDVYVKAICSASEESVWVGPYSFNTSCDVISLPWSEDFAADTTPLCWEETGDNSWDYSLNADYAAQDILDNTPGGGTNYAWMDGGDNTDGEVSSLTSPLIDISTLTEPALEFFLFSNNTDDAAVNLIDVEFFDGANWNSVLNVSTLLGGSWNQYVIDLAPYTITGAVQVRFTVTGNSNGGSTYYNDVLLDDVTFIQMPDCANPIASYEVVGNCMVGAEFFVEVDLTNMSGTDDIIISDNQTPAQTETVSATGVYQFGPYDNGTDVVITLENNLDAGCSATSPSLTQEFCTETYIDCDVDSPFNVVYCYDNGEDYEITYVSTDGTPLNLEVNSGNVENNWDEFIVLDTDGTELYNGYGNAGDLTGLSFQSIGAEITVIITPDTINSCESSGTINPIDYTISCATCVNPQVTFAVEGNCSVGPEFFVEVDLTDMGSATSITLTDDQTPAETQTVTATGVYQLGPYVNGTDVVISIANDDDANCVKTSSSLTQELCIETYLDCAVDGPFNAVYCYDSGEDYEVTYISTDGTTPLNLNVNSGNVENNWDEFIVIDSDGTTELYNGYGNAGDLAGLSFQSTGAEITVKITPDGSGSCQSNSTYDSLDYTVACATCVNPQVNFEVVADCAVDPQFLIDVEITDLGSATDLILSDGDTANDQTIAATGTYTFGPYVNGDLINISVLNADDINCEINSGDLTQEYCTALTVECAAGPQNASFCYGNDETNEIVFTSDDGTVLNLTINAGQMSTFGDDFIILDSDGTTQLYNGTGNNGDLTGLTFQSTGDNITVRLISNGFTSCESNDYTPIDITVACATCVNPEVTYFKDCDPTNQEFSIDVEITDLGSAGSVEISDDQGSASQTLTTVGIVSFGPFAYDTEVVITTENLDDANCTIVSAPITSDECPPIPCLEAEPFCSDEGLIFANVDDTSGTTAPPGIDYGCLGSQPNPVWYFLQIEDPGDLSIEMVQNTSFDENGNPTGDELDVDFIAWGPFDDVDSACNGLTVQNQVPDSDAGDGCSYSAAPEETFGIENAQEGDVYVLLITNFNGDAGFITLNQIDGDGSTDCSIIDENTTYACGDDPVTLTSQYPTALAYVWYMQDVNGDYIEIDGETTMDLTVTEGGIYRLDTFNNTGELQQEIFTVIYSEEPDLSNVDDTVSFCGTTSTTLDATIANPNAFDTVTYQWSDENGPLAGETQAALTVTEAGFYTVDVAGVVLDEDGNPTSQTCESSMTIEVTTADFTVDAGADQSACDAEEITLTAAVAGADTANATYDWVDSAGNTVGSTETITVTQADLYTVTVTIDGCVASDDVEVSYNNTPSIDLGSDISTCDISGVVIDATPAMGVAGVTFDWTYNGTS